MRVAAKIAKGTLKFKEPTDKFQKNFRRKEKLAVLLTKSSASFKIFPRENIKIKKTTPIKKGAVSSRRKYNFKIFIIFYFTI
ncbi:MAG: hypothetical protein AUJ76_00540 [Candidatus Omnitrophica bacterium CG1_02_41_171]|nr:MAG: hypothetical protein AUJ76_00540 [Candidatus Omnitrophica bacterium CG1_02_41_171]